MWLEILKLHWCIEKLQGNTFMVVLNNLVLMEHLTDLLQINQHMKNKQVQRHKKEKKKVLNNYKKRKLLQLQANRPERVTNYTETN